MTLGLWFLKHYMFTLIFFLVVLPNFVIGFIIYYFLRAKPKADITDQIVKAVQRAVNQKQRAGISRTIKMDEAFSWEPREGVIRQFLAIYDGYLVIESFAGRPAHAAESNLYKLNREFIQVWEAVHPKGLFFSHLSTNKGYLLAFDNDKKVWKLDTDTGYVEPWRIQIS